ncbi:MAG TPA: hypothetical protein VK775_19860, partial [Chthoniobacterales bacterium]|nr:hypothetical protein [Chthoniobacterales bacterium]
RTTPKGEIIAQRSRRSQRGKLELMAENLGEHRGFRARNYAKGGNHRTEVTEVTEEGNWS